jgi:uncharacterized protein (TIGR03000 family)
VPADADVWFDGFHTHQQGTTRSFVTPLLTPGKSFFYDIRARWTNNQGQAVERTRKVTVQAGQNVTVDFLKE